ncbi:MAG: DUF3616 domain-containing protein [Verrucomicrobiae bacterium]|nr:DUF3616 domain-containing protein [Verrucomicrobiae bacterium]
MKQLKSAVAYLGLWLGVGLAGVPLQGAEITICRGMCDASAVVMLDNDYFVVANDEDNRLRVYSRTRGGSPIQSSDWSAFLSLDPRSPETDLEGSAVLDGRAYWISSHARNKNGKDRPSRRQFFATTIGITNGAITLEPSGKAYTGLLNDLLQAKQLRAFDLAAAAQRAPKTAGALNIESLCATPDGELLIGFRNPIPDGKALLVPLLNPAELMLGTRARLGDPIRLDLGGLGLRDMTWFNGRYYLIAGTYNGKGHSVLYEWNGGAATPRLLSHPELKGLNPEAMAGFVENDQPRLLVVSDDGTLKIGGVDCKEVADPEQRYFRVTVIDL